MFTVRDANDTFNVTIQGTPPPVDEYVFTGSDGLYTFTWTPTSTQTVSIQFLAMDSRGVPTLLHPLVRLCSCRLDLNATCVDMDGDGGADNFLMQDCMCGSGDKIRNILIICLQAQTISLPLLVGYGGSYCGADVDGCINLDCFPGVNCTDKPAPLTGATCGDCPIGTRASNESCFGTVLVFLS